MVADGQTNFLDGIATNLSNGVVIGTNGFYTLLVLTNGAAVSNANGISQISSALASRSNTMVVTGTGSAFNNGPGVFYIGQNGSSAELDILNGGTMITRAGAVIAVGATSSNNLALVSGSGSTWSNSATFYVGSGGANSALVISNGGLVISGNTEIEGVSNKAIVTGSNSTWSSGYLTIGNGATRGSQLIVSNGGLLSLDSGGTCDIGVYSGSNALIITDPGSTVRCPMFRMGYSSTKNIGIISNGATFYVSNSNPYYSTVEGNQTAVTVTGTNSLWTNNADLYFGQVSNVLSILNGGTVADVNGYVFPGSLAGTNTVIVAGTNSQWRNSGDLHLGGINTQLIITNGGMVSNSFCYLGEVSNYVSSNCSVYVAGPGSLWTNNSTVNIGYSGSSNALVVTDSGAVKAAAVQIGASSTSNLVVVSNAGTLAAANVYVGNPAGNNTNLLQVAGGLVSATTAIQIYPGSSLTITSGSFYTKSLSANGSGKVILSSGTLLTGGTSYLGSGTNHPAFIIGDGTNAGILSLSNGTHTFSGGLVVSSNSTLTGFGSVNATIAIGNGGTFVPSTNAGTTFVIPNNLVLSNGSTTVMTLSGPAVPQNSVGGMSNVVYGGTLQLLNGGGAYSPGQPYQLFHASNYSGAFTNVIPATPGPNLRWDLDEMVVDGVVRILSAFRPIPLMQFSLPQPGVLQIQGTQGTTYDVCYLYSTTNVMLSNSWICVGTNAFDTSGSVIFTNPIQSDEPLRFFRLQLK